MTSNQSFSHIGRLKKRSEFLAVRKGSRLRGKYFLLEMLDRQAQFDQSQPPGPRVGFTVTKRQGNAVKRNRIRRRLKAAVRLAAYKYLKPGHDYVFVGHKEILEAGFDDIIYTLEQRFNIDKNSDKTRASRK